MERPFADAAIELTFDVRLVGSPEKLRLIKFGIPASPYRVGWMLALVTVGLLIISCLKSLATTSRALRASRSAEVSL